jgi:hypothetical protein
MVNIMEYFGKTRREMQDNVIEQTLKTKLRGLSPRANYIDQATADLSTKLVPTFADRGCHVVSGTDPYGRILGFLDRVTEHITF